VKEAFLVQLVADALSEVVRLLAAVPLLDVAVAPLGDLGELPRITALLKPENLSGSKSLALF
jgi:hypothetical protein